SVSAGLPGANADTMASAGATPLERQFTGVAGLDSMISVSSPGSTPITFQFDLNPHAGGAALGGQTAVAGALAVLPPRRPAPPPSRKHTAADSPIMMISVTSPTLPLWTLNEYADTMVAQRISMVSGVAQVQVMGAQRYAVRVQVDPARLAAKQIGINEVSAAIQSWNVNLPTGTLYGNQQAFNLKATGQLMDAAAYRPLVVAYRNGAPGRLEQLGHVIDSVEDNKTASWFYTPAGGVRSISLMIMRQPGSNVIEATDQIKRLLPSITAQLPPSVRLELRSDRSKNIREAFGD